jgi:hypothetical protein
MRAGSQFFLQACAHGTLDHEVDGLTFPPTVHIAFAQSKTAQAEQPLQGLGMLDLNIPRSAAIQMNIC